MLRRLPWPDILFVLLLLLLTGWFLSRAPVQRVQFYTLGSVDHLTARSFHPAETTAEGRGFRWTDGASTLLLQNQGFAPHRLQLTLKSGHPQQPAVTVEVRANGQTLAQMSVDQQTRQYTLLVPANQVAHGQK
ncbi:MAG: hypothetical protein HC837_09720 [Chloroflexaceae bacterium]|nr:hypothetical protein [Chloroflexaceae bacterium]